MLGGRQPEHSEQIYSLLASRSTFTGHLELLQVSSAFPERRSRQHVSWTPQVARLYISLFWGGFIRPMDEIHGALVRERC